MKSNKFTARSEEYFRVDEHVTKGLRLVKKAFGDHWGEWSRRVVLVVESNLCATWKQQRFLPAAQSSKVIVITAGDHLTVYVRALRGFIADGPIIYDASLVRLYEGGRSCMVLPQPVRAPLVLANCAGVFESAVRRRLRGVW